MAVAESVMTSPEAGISKGQLWAGRIISGLVVLMMLMSAAFKLMKPPDVVKEFTRLGYQEMHALTLGILEFVCVALYAIPRTSMFAAILLTGYLGGAVATHVRIGDPFFMPIVIGVFVWLGLWLRDRRVRSILPLS